MIFWITKRLTFVLILCLGVMQLLLPFIHAHYDSDSVHADNSAHILHIKGVQNKLLTSYPTFQPSSYESTSLVNLDVETKVLNVGEVMPRQKHYKPLVLFAVLIAMIAVVSVSSTSIPYGPTLLFKRRLRNRRSLSRAPPYS